MRQLRIVKNLYTFFTISLIILGTILLIWPMTTIGLLTKILGIVLMVFGMIKILGYLSKDMFQLAFQFDLGLGIVSIIAGVVMLFRTEHLVELISVLLGIIILIEATLKIQTAIEAKRFGLYRWWIILFIALLVTLVGILLVIMPWKTTRIITRLVGVNLCLDGILNLWVVQNTVSTLKR